MINFKKKISLTDITKIYTFDLNKKVGEGGFGFVVEGSLIGNPMKKFAIKCQKLIEES
jgi:hypothetical protein